MERLGELVEQGIPLRSVDNDTIDGDEDVTGGVHSSNETASNNTTVTADEAEEKAKEILILLYVACGGSDAGVSDPNALSAQALMLEVGKETWNETLGLIFTSMPAPKIASGPESSFRTNDEILLPSTVFAQIQTLWTDHDSNYPILVKLLLTDVVSRFMLHRKAPGFPPALAACCDPVEAVQLSCGETVFSRSL